MSTRRLHTEADLTRLRTDRSKKDELETWLNRMPTEMCFVIASRIGLRSLPFVVGLPVDCRFGLKQRKVIASAFRYATVGRLLIKYPSGALEVLATVLGTTSYATGSYATACIRESSRIAPAFTDVGSRSRYKGMVATHAAYVAMLSALSDAGAAWDAILADRLWLETHEEPFELLDCPMWLSADDRCGFYQTFSTRWQEMRDALRADDDSWIVWTDWFQHRISGGENQDDHLDYIRLCLSVDINMTSNDLSIEGRRMWREKLESQRDVWQADPKKANRLIVNLFKEVYGI